MTTTIGLLALAFCLGAIYLFIDACASLMGGLMDEDEE
jgi:hypothetical protein